MEWVNKETGAVIITDCTLGGAWVKKEEEPKEEPKPEKAEKKKKGK